MSDGGDGSFEERLRAARSRQGLDQPPPNAPAGSSDGRGFSALGVGLRVGVELVSALSVGVLIGWLLDGWLHTRPAFLSLFVLLGGAAGLLNVWRTVAPKPGSGGPLGGRTEKDGRRGG